MAGKSIMRPLVIKGLEFGMSRSLMDCRRLRTRPQSRIKDCSRQGLSVMCLSKIGRAHV